MGVMAYKFVSEESFKGRDIISMRDFNREEIDCLNLINRAFLGGAKPDLSVMHPLPRVTEIATDVDGTPHALYFRQMKHGIYVRMALIALVLGAL